VIEKVPCMYLGILSLTRPINSGEVLFLISVVC